MNPIIKVQWLAALRSGAYEQTQYQLCDGHAFCCLGVLYDHHPGKQWEVHPSDATHYRYVERTPEECEDEEGTVFLVEHVEIGDVDLTPAVLAWAGLDDDTQQDLISLNDKQGQSFAEIADWIEANL